MNEEEYTKQNDDEIHFIFTSFTNEKQRLLEEERLRNLEKAQQKTPGGSQGVRLMLKFLKIELV